MFTVIAKLQKQKMLQISLNSFRKAAANLVRFFQNICSSCSKHLIWIKMIRIWKSHFFISRIRLSVLLLCWFFKATLDWITLIKMTKSGLPVL